MVYSLLLARVWRLVCCMRLYLAQLVCFAWPPPLTMGEGPKGVSRGGNRSGPDGPAGPASWPNSSRESETPAAVLS